MRLDQLVYAIYSQIHPGKQILFLRLIIWRPPGRHQQGVQVIPPVLKLGTSWFYSWLHLGYILMARPHQAMFKVFHCLVTLIFVANLKLRFQSIAVRLTTGVLQGHFKVSRTNFRVTIVLLVLKYAQKVKTK